MNTIKIKPRETFFLNKEVCLEATTAVRLYLPVGLLADGERVEDVVNLSNDDIEIGLKESRNKPGKLSSLIVFLKPGVRVTLHRSAEALVDNDDGAEVIFNVVASSTESAGRGR